MIYLEYLVVAAIVVLLSIKASNYVDLLDKNTKMSGAFLGGIMLSAVTSLPELFTSISATLLVHKPGLCIGNILGSDLFNVAAIAFIIFFFFNKFARGRVAKSYRFVALSVIAIYIVLALNYLHIIEFTVLSISITSVLIILLYIIGATFLATVSDNDADEDALEYEASKKSSLSVRQIIVRFFFTSVGIIAFSIMITYLTDDIAIQLNLGQGLAGALFLGIATSLPELSSTIALFRMGNFDIAVGNIVGSNLFNFIILAIADIISRNSLVYDYSDPKTVSMLIFGVVAMVCFWIMLKFRNRIIQFISSSIIILSYVGFLVM